MRETKFAHIGCATMCFLTTLLTTSGTVANDGEDLFKDFQVASNTDLAEMRGGFVTSVSGQRLEMAFAIEEAITVNDKTFVTRLNVPNINDATRATIQQLVNDAFGSASAVSQSADPSNAASENTSAPKTAGSSPSSVTIAPTTDVASRRVPTQLGTPSISLRATPAVAAAEANAAPSDQTPSLQIVNTKQGALSITTLQAPNSVVNLVQNGPGNSFTINGAQLPNGVLNVIQNTLDNQTIRQVTTIQMSVNSLGLMRAMSWGSALQRQIAGSVR